MDTKIKNIFIKALSYCLIVNLLFSNAIYGISLSPISKPNQKLAPSSHIFENSHELTSRYIKLGVIKTFIASGVFNKKKKGSNNVDSFSGSSLIKEAIKERFAVPDDESDIDNIEFLYGLVRNPADSANPSIYVVATSPSKDKLLMFRFRPVGATGDNLFNTLNLLSSPGEAGEITVTTLPDSIEVEGTNFLQEVVEVPKELYGFVLEAPWQGEYSNVTADGVMWQDLWEQKRAKETYSSFSKILQEDDPGVSKVERLRLMLEDDSLDRAHSVFIKLLKRRNVERESSSLEDYIFGAEGVLIELENLERNNRSDDNPLGKTNWKRLMKELKEELYGKPHMQELFWLLSIFHPIGKTGDPQLSSYYHEGKRRIEELLEVYYEQTGHVPVAQRQRLVTLGGEFVLRFGDLRAIYMGERTPRVLSQIQQIEGLNKEDQQTLLTMLNVFTFVYSKPRRSKAEAGNTLFETMKRKTGTLEKVDRYVDSMENRDEGGWFHQRMEKWFGSSENRASAEERIKAIVPDKGEREDFKKFIKEINLFNATETFAQIRYRMDSLRAEHVGRKDEYARALMLMFYFFYKLSKFKTTAGSTETIQDKLTNNGQWLQWLVFEDNGIAEDIINRFLNLGKTAEEARAAIDSIFEETMGTDSKGEGNYIRDTLFDTNPQTRCVLLGIPIYLDRNRIVVDIKRERSVSVDNDDLIEDSERRQDRQYGRGAWHGINKQERVLREANAGGDYYDLVVIVTDKASEKEKQMVVEEARKSGALPPQTKCVVVSQPSGNDPAAGEWMIKGNFSAIVNLMCNKNLTVDGVPDSQNLGDYIKSGKNVAVVLSAGTAKRNFPMTEYGCKGQMNALNGVPYLVQSIKQLAQNYNPGQKGLFITSNDGTKCVSQQINVGKHGFQIIGAAKPALIGPTGDTFNQVEVGELGCMEVDTAGNIRRFVEKPNKKKWKEKLGGVKRVPTNWADYFMKPDFLNELIKVYGRLETKDPRQIPGHKEYNKDYASKTSKLIYLKYGLDTAKDFSIPCTVPLKDYIAQKVKEGWYEGDAKIVWKAANKMKKDYKIGFVDAGEDAIFKDTGTNQTYKDFAKELVDKENGVVLRELLGMTAENGYKWVNDNLIGPNVSPDFQDRVTSGQIRIGKGSLIVGKVRIEEGEIGNNCVINDCLARRVDVADDTMIFTAHRPDGEIKVKKPGLLVTDRFVDPNNPKVPSGFKDLSGVELVELDGPEGKVETYKVNICVPTSVKANDTIFNYNLSVGGVNQLLEVKNGVITKCQGNPMWVNSKVEEGKKKDLPVLVAIGEEGQERVLGQIKEKTGGDFWKDLHLWPRGPKSAYYESDPAVYQCDPSKPGDFPIAATFEKLNSWRHHAATTAYKNELDIALHGEPEKPISMLDLFDSQVEVLEMDPNKGSKTFSASSGKVPVKVKVKVPQKLLSSVKVIIWCGDLNKSLSWKGFEMTRDQDSYNEGVCTFKGEIDVAEYEKFGSQSLAFTAKVILSGTVGEKWLGGFDDNAVIDIVKSQASFLPRIVRPADDSVRLWQIQFDEQGRILDEGVTQLVEDHERLGELEEVKKAYEEVWAMLVARFKSTGIVGAVHGMIVTDNLKEQATYDEDGELVAPGAVVEQIEGKRYIVVDIDVFKEDLIARYLILNHDFKLSILQLIEENDAMAELTMIFMSLWEALHLESNGPAYLEKLGIKYSHWNILKKIKEQKTDNPYVLISLAIEHMRKIPYYKNLFDKLGLNLENWDTAVMQAFNMVASEGEVTKSAVDIYCNLSGEVEADRMSKIIRRISYNEQEVRRSIDLIKALSEQRITASEAQLVQYLTRHSVFPTAHLFGVFEESLVVDGAV